MKFFEHVKNKYPYSRFSVLAELKLADSKFDQDKFAEAAEGYKSFVKLHPTHEQADYAAYRIGLAYFKDAPGDFFILPPSYEKDQAQVKTAITHLEDFIKSYPDSKWIADAKKTLAEAQGKLAQHEWYVAQFYRKRGRWPGAAGRLALIVKDYPGSVYEAEALWELSEAYLNMNEEFRAKQALKELIVKHPQDPHAKDAAKVLKQ